MLSLSLPKRYYHSSFIEFARTAIKCKQTNKDWSNRLAYFVPDFKWNDAGILGFI